MLKTCQNRTQPSGAPSTADNDGDDLDTRLLEGALKNLDYFPQLLKEVQHIKKGKQLMFSKIFDLYTSDFITCLMYEMSDIRRPSILEEEDEGDKKELPAFWVALNPLVCSR